MRAWSDHIFKAMAELHGQCSGGQHQLSVQQQADLEKLWSARGTLEILLAGNDNAGQWRMTCAMRWEPYAVTRSYWGKPFRSAAGDTGSAATTAQGHCGRHRRRQHHYLHSTARRNTGRDSGGRRYCRESGTAEPSSESSGTPGIYCRFRGRGPGRPASAQYRYRPAGPDHARYERQRSTASHQDR